MDGFGTALGSGLASGIVAIVAVLLAENLRRRHERPSLRVKASLGYIHGYDTLKDTQLFMITATNSGGRTATVEEYGYTLKGESNRMMHVPSVAATQLQMTVPKEIAPEGSVSHFIEQETLFGFFDKDGHTPRKLMTVYYRDRVGTFHHGKVSRVTRKELERRYRIHRQKN